MIDKEKLKQDINKTIDKYKDLPMDVISINESFIEEMANVVISQAFDIQDFAQSITILRKEAQK
jgi:hypothetical protein